METAEKIKQAQKLADLGPEVFEDIFAITRALYDRERAVTAKQEVVAPAPQPPASKPPQKPRRVSPTPPAAEPQPNRKKKMPAPVAPEPSPESQPSSSSGDAVDEALSGFEDLDA